MPPIYVSELTRGRNKGSECESVCCDDPVETTRKSVYRSLVKVVADGGLRDLDFDVLKCDDMSGIAGATMVTSTAARKLGKANPSISLHCRMVLWRDSAFSLAASSALTTSS